MSTTLSDVRTLIRRDVLKDSGSTQKYSDTQILSFINLGIRLSWPHCFTYVTDSSTTTSQTAGISTYTNREYSLPSGVPSYPQRMPIHRVELGPIGGQRISDSLQFGDRYRLLKSQVPGGKLWDVDWSRRKLILAFEPPYDTGLVYQYFIRLGYVRPVALLASDTDVLEGPDALVPALLELGRYYGALYREPSALTDAERLQSIGAWEKAAKEAWLGIVQMHGLRMAWPKVTR